MNHIKTYSARASSFLVIMPYTNVRYELVANNPYEILELEVEFGVIVWSSDWDMIFERPAHEVSLTIIELSL
jgi:hypothetical protein